ncbi:MAG: hypothetical protein M0R46_03745 [Candidatus Muirbacterium halophilum]|nr:hypothetical protein [Candidatus Muirbacterium halophilum]MCK9475004.1 hypothetical protein [Candidatus Muirbacterium halophilum]
MWADLCNNCLRECKQNKGTKIITCKKFIEQLGLKFGNSKKVKKSDRARGETGIREIKARK